VKDMPARNGRPHVILCADDYGLSAGASRAIRELGADGRLSATSAIATLDRWPQDARELRAIRDRVAIGLHINLTLGRPLGPMPTIARDGRLPTLGTLLALALTGRIDGEEISAEVARQLARFESELGFAPDHIDGHQHVHALPGIRQGVLTALATRFPSGGPLVRDPADRPSRILARGSAVGKALLIGLLAFRFGGAARARGFAVNASFAGVSSFDRRMPYATELAAALATPSERHLIMCHPGHADAALATIDPVAGRREDEYDAIARFPNLPALLWRPARGKDGPPVAWAETVT
jgi:chitin disaccharide deacetylase